MRNRRIAIDIVGATPEKQIARLERVEFERIRMTAQDCIEISRLAHPDILLAGIPRHIGKSVLSQNVINEAGAIHTAVCRIGGTVCVTEILLC